MPHNMFTGSDGVFPKSPEPSFATDTWGATSANCCRACCCGNTLCETSLVDNRFYSSNPEFLSVTSLRRCPSPELVTHLHMHCCRVSPSFGLNFDGLSLDPVNEYRLLEVLFNCAWLYMTTSVNYNVVLPVIIYLKSYLLDKYRRVYSKELL